MNSPLIEAQQVTVTDDSLVVDLVSGRTVSVPLAWYPRLVHATAEERAEWRLIGRGAGIHWDDLDEDMSVEGLLAGRPSGESQRLLDRWLRDRTNADRPPTLGQTPKRRRTNDGAKVHRGL